MFNFINGVCGFYFFSLLVAFISGMLVNNHYLDPRDELSEYKGYVHSEMYFNDNVGLDMQNGKYPLYKCKRYEYDAIYQFPKDECINCHEFTKK